LPPVIEEYSHVRADFLVNALSGSVGIIVEDLSDIDFTHVGDVRARSEGDVNDGRLIVGPGNEADLAIEISLSNAVAGRRY
jgi:hypothetical protein